MIYYPSFFIHRNCGRSVIGHRSDCLYHHRAFPQEENVLGRILIHIIYSLYDNTLVLAEYFFDYVHQFMILVAFFSVCILATWCLDAYNATVESGLLTANDAGFVAANNQYNILPITIAACIVGVVVWLIIVSTTTPPLVSYCNSCCMQSYVFIVSLVVHKTTYDDITAGVTAPSA